MTSRALLFVAALALAVSAYFAYAKELEITIGDITSPAFSARGVRAHLSGAGFKAVALEIDTLTAAGQTFRKAKVTCAHFELTSAAISCEGGILESAGKLPLRFSYDRARRDLDLEIKAAADETYRLKGRVGSNGALELTLANANLERVRSYLPASFPPITAGRASGSATLRGSALTAALDVSGVSFADKSGLHAGEKIAGRIEADATRDEATWRWKARIEWRAGEVFWQPFYAVAKRQRLELDAATRGTETSIAAGRFDAPAIGSVAFNGRWDHRASAFSSLEAHAAQLNVGALYDEILKPLLQETALADLRAGGNAGVDIRADRGGLTAIDVNLANVSFDDKRRRFGVFGVSGRLPWHRDDRTQGEIAFKGAEFLKLPIGALRMPLQLRRNRIDVAALQVPVLDGVLSLRDFAAGRAADGWRWRLSGELSPISMERLTQTLSLPVMHGVLAGVIPEVRYRRDVLSIDGELAMRVFDGTIRADHVELIEPFGRAPRLHANLAVRELDLDLLTRTFDFGAITGRIDADVKGLELVSWEPTRFDARIVSSPGHYRRRISQRAVQNISALGGAGAAAAIQRSFLRFFKEFSYDTIGVACRLENGVCEMSGVEPTPQGYVIIKGGGVPALTVIGYNRYVSWRELVDRLKRVTRDNVKPIIK